MSLNISISKTVLLTGAGFTKDFGGFLAEEMWSFIFNSPSLDSFPRVKDLLRRDFSYESVYHDIIDGKYAPEEKDRIKKAVNSAYDRLDENIRQYKSRNMSGNILANATSATNFIREFESPNANRGFFFTLNQDMFVERYCRDAIGLSTPGVTIQDISQDRELDQLAYQQLPNDDTVAKFNNKNLLSTARLLYIKLHGSYNWRDASGNSYMVIGKAKEDLISKEPLLKYYFELFKNVLSSGNVKLFVIGYGFNDEHINKVIADSIWHNGLRLHIMNQVAQDAFSRVLPKKPHCESLWEVIKCYYPYTISMVFPPDGKAISSTIQYAQIMENFFERQ